MKKSIGLFFLILFVLSSATFAQEIQTTGDYMSSVGTKLVRGLENVITSPAEIPCTMEKDMSSGDALLGFFTGLGSGTVYFLRRVLVGVTEVASFMIPMERTIPRVCTEPAPATSENANA